MLQNGYETITSGAQFRLNMTIFTGLPQTQLLSRKQFNRQVKLNFQCNRFSSSHSHIRKIGIPILFYQYFPRMIQANSARTNPNITQLSIFKSRLMKMPCLTQHPNKGKCGIQIMCLRFVGCLVQMVHYMMKSLFVGFSF